ncbi:MAG: feruloyl-CoA synthase [Solimonas sp.]
MSAALPWTPDAFATEVERRSDGCMILKPLASIAPYPPRLTDKLVEWAQRTPDATLVARRSRDRDGDGDGEWQRVSYAQMLSHVQRIAAGLATYNLSADKPIIILSGNSIEHLTLSLAAMWIGVPYCPVSPAYSLVAQDFQKLEYIFKLLTPGLVVAFETEKFSRAIHSVVPADCIVVGDTRIKGRNIMAIDELQQEPSTAIESLHAVTGADTIAKFLLTSGSTGAPKAVITTQRMICANAVMVRQSMPFLAETPPVLVDWLPWNHTFGGTHNVSVALFNGGSLYIDDGKPTPAGMKETIRNLREISPTVYFNVPKGYEMLVHAMREDAALRHSFYKNLRAYFFAAASMSQHTWDELDALSMQELGFKLPMLSGLGATETGPSVTFTTPAASRAGVIGLPAAGNVVKLAPVGDKLEMRARGDNVTPGYWRSPELTAAAFDDEGFYKLGDAVRLIDPVDPTRGLRFDGRIAEDFKLATGTWVSVGPLRAELLMAFAPYLQDVVIAGLDRDYLTILMIPDVAACVSAVQREASCGYDELVNNLKLRELLRERLVAHALRHASSSTCVLRAMLLPSPPKLDIGEITDKGSINQRAVLKYRAECVEMLYQDSPPEHVIVI